MSNTYDNLRLTDSELYAGSTNILYFMIGLAFIVFVIVVGFTISRVMGRRDGGKWDGGCDCS